MGVCFALFAGFQIILINLLIQSTVEKSERLFVHVACGNQALTTILWPAKAKDTILESVIAYRAGWSATKQWQGQRHLVPEGFDGEGQLANLANIAPHLF